MKRASHIAVLLVTLLAVGFGCGEENTEVPPPVPLEGQWFSSSLEFDIADQHVTRLAFGGWGCIGELTSAGSPSCTSLLDGDILVDVPIDPVKGSFRMETVYGLVLDGAFDDERRLSGKFTYVADNQCCESEGEWTAVHASLAEDEPPAVCQTAPTGEEILEVWIQPDPAADPIPISDDGVITAVQGFQGAIMVVATLMGSDFSLGNLTVTLSLSLPAVGVVGEVVGSGEVFESAYFGYEWRDVWLVLEDAEGHLLDPFNPAHPELIAGQPAIFTATLTNPCGFTMQITHEGTLNYLPL